MLDFSKAPVILRNANTSSKPQTATDSILTEAQPIYDAALKREAKACVIVAIDQPNKDIIDEFAVPTYQKPASVEPPECSKSNPRALIQEYKELFQTTPGVTNDAYDFIPTTGNPVKVHASSSYTSTLPRRSKKTNSGNAGARHHQGKYVVAYGWLQLFSCQRNLGSCEFVLTTGS